MPPVAKLYNSATPTLAVYPTPTPTIGGGVGSTNILGNSVGELHPVMAAAMTGGGSRTSIAKFFIVNTDADTDLIGGTVNLANSLDDSPSGPFYPSVTPGLSTDDSTYFARFIGWDTQLVPQPLTSDVACNGAVQVTAGDQFSKVVAVESRDVTSGALKATTSPWLVKNGSTTQGIMLAGYYSCTAEITIALNSVLNDTTTTTDAQTPPGGAVFTKPRSEATGIPIVNGQVLTKNNGAQGGWSQWVVGEMRKPSIDIQVIIQVNGQNF